MTAGDSEHQRRQFITARLALGTRYILLTFQRQSVLSSRMGATSCRPSAGPSVIVTDNNNNNNYGHVYGAVIMI